MMLASLLNADYYAPTPHFESGRAGITNQALLILKHCCVPLSDTAWHSRHYYLAVDGLVRADKRPQTFALLRKAAVCIPVHSAEERCSNRFQQYDSMISHHSRSHRMNGHIESV